MKWYEILSLLAAIISIVGAVISCFNLGVIEKTKKEIFSLLKVIKFSNISDNTQTNLEYIRKIAHKAKIPRGTNIDEIVTSLNKYFEKIFKLTSEKEVENSEHLNSLIKIYREKINEISLIPRNNEAHIINCFNEIYEMTLNIDQEFSKLTKKIVEK